MKRLLRIGLFLLICGAALLFYVQNKSVVTGWLMLFQQNSSQSIVGWLNKAENPALTTVFLSAFQAFAMPFKTMPRIVMAAVAVFGFWGGWLLAVLGRLIAIALWYAVGRLLVGISFKNDRGMPLLYGGLSCFFTAYAAPLALFCGVFSLKFWKVLAVSIPVQMAVLGFYGKYASIYSSTIPNWCGYVTYGAGIALLVAALIFRKK